MKPIQSTAHARERQQQRGISDLKLQLIQQFGTFKLQKGGSHIAYIDRKTLVQLRRAIDKLDGKVAVVGESEYVISVMPQTRRINTTDYAA